MCASEHRGTYRQVHRGTYRQVHAHTGAPLADDNDPLQSIHVLTDPVTHAQEGYASRDRRAEQTSAADHEPSHI